MEMELELKKEQLNTMEKTREADNLRAMLTGQEKERMRIARDLHDSLGSLLATVKYQFESFIEQAVRKKDNSDNQMGQLIDQACEEVRRIAHDTMPQALSETGIVGAVDDLARPLRQAGLTVHVQSVGVVDGLQADQEVMLYRIIQELLQNVLKHANATQVIVQFNQLEKRMYVTVEDNGVGMNGGTDSTGMGLKNIQSRITFLKADLDIDSIPGQGTTVSIEIPIMDPIT